MKVCVLGSGTSTGVPVPGCDCAVCTSDDSKNKRFRTSILVEISSGDRPAEINNTAPRSTESSSEENNLAILIDTSPDLRMQALKNGITSIDCVLYTHTHADHVNGIDDLRAFSFRRQSPIDVYAGKESAEALERSFSYAFYPNADYEGGLLPRLKLHRLKPFKPLLLGGMSFLPLPLKHGSMDVFGYRIGKFAYLTDCSQIPEKSREHLYDLDLLIIDGLRRRPHKTHFTQQQAVEEIEKLQPKRAYLTHVSHDVDHEDSNDYLRTLTSRTVELAYDGLLLEV